jgi:coenzyme F420-reducing hydrogenase delta subunit
MKIIQIMNYRNHLIALLLSLGTLSLQGQQMTDSKTFMKSFRAGADAVVDVTNKYGNIHISHGNADSVSVRVEVTASSDKESKLSSMMSDVDVSITMTNETVHAETTFNKGITPLLESLKGLTKNIINYGSRLKIDYFIECPPSAVLRITNSYGDVYIGDETPELTLKLSNGSLDAGLIDYAREIDLTFCKANVRSIREGKIILSFSELRMKGAEKIKLTSSSSKVWIDSCGTLDIDSKSDDINLGSVSVITGISHFSDINTGNISGELSLAMKYGNLSCEKIDEKFSLIDISSSYTDVDLLLPEKASYDLEIRHTNAFVSLPGITPEPERTTVSEEDKIYITSGRYGSSPDSSKIRIDATRGEIRILQK